MNENLLGTIQAVNGIIAFYQADENLQLDFLEEKIFEREYVRKFSIEFEPDELEELCHVLDSMGKDASTEWPKIYRSFPRKHESIVISLAGGFVAISTYYQNNHACTGKLSSLTESNRMQFSKNEIDRAITLIITYAKGIN